MTTLPNPKLFPPLLPSSPSKPNFFFSSDLHFDHQNVIKYCDRPFGTTAHMNRCIIEDHNSVVRPWDRVFLLGDLGWLSGEQTLRHLRQMNGHKTLIKGNHDHHQDLKAWGGLGGVIADWTHYKELRIEGDAICLSHFPMLSWHKMHKGSYHLHGHCHGAMQYPQPLADMRILDVGIDHIYKLTGSYAPLSWDQIKTLLASRCDGIDHDHHTGQNTSMAPVTP